MTTTGNSSPLALCIVIISTRASRSPASSSASESSDNWSTNPASDGSGAARLVFARGRHELHEVLDAALGLLAALLAQVLQVAALVEDLAERDRDGFAAPPSRSWRRSGRETPSATPAARGASSRCSTACTSLAQSELLSRRAGAGQEGRRRRPAASSSTASSDSITPLPMPRAGTLMTRRRLTSSCGLRTQLQVRERRP